MKELRGTVEKSREKEKKGKKGKKEREERRGSVGKKWKETIFFKRYMEKQRQLEC